MATATTMERTNKPSVEEIESIRLSTRNLAVPEYYTELFTKMGVAYYCQHQTRTTSYLHPAKFRALQAAGVLHPATSDLPAYALRLYCDDYTVPRHRERRRDDKGRAYYLNHEAKKTQWEHPEAEAVLAKARGEGREGEPSWSLSAAVAGDGDAPVTGHRRLLRKWEEDYTAEGVLPPWILEETAAPPEGAGWSRSETQSPFDAREARARIRKRKQQGLPVHCTPKVKM
ncbi:hypothetical protein GGTG_04221 [Gaeumannomyces tritici R3-111a-1]|uniref:WW domain-containing protein n=1 Tax=Gaeumannomyces tritici (strain R3-111a-1) TaxID=644352 RepID=J3NSG9_GAET3|nr:hypothetical protein GGTG_04221 [Gaeumannomyces tritici R3-111a-1]EJT79132.1 hypothetical protein GGTG_04221 [Gaeumannomyces tritici R3-111a-1]